MSFNEWERGTLVLPAAGVVQVKTAVREHCRKFHADVRAEVVALHTRVGKGTRSAKVYRTRLSEARREHAGAAEKAVGFRRSTDYRILVKSAALSVLDQVVMRAEGRLGGEPGSVRTPTADDQLWVAPPVTNRSTLFGVSGQWGGIDAAITFDGREVSWDVPENNRAVESSRNAPLGQVFFAALDEVRWTRGSGGVIISNNEANRESDCAGGGANFINSGFGPLGEAAQAAECGMKLAAYRAEEARDKELALQNGWR